MNKKTVRIEYKNAEGVLVGTEDMELTEYTTMKKLALQRVIGDVEKLIYTMNGNLPRAQWGEETMKQFSAIRRQLLDVAGDVGRIPEQMTCACERPKENSVQKFWKDMLGAQ